MNREAFLAVADAIELDAASFDLTHFVNRVGERWELGGQKLTEKNLCNTTMCIAGWANWIANDRKNIALKTLIGSETAADFLGITYEQSERLFFVGNPGCVWLRCKDITGWNPLAPDESSYWSNLEGHKAAKVLRMIAEGEITL